MLQLDSLRGAGSTDYSNANGSGNTNNSGSSSTSLPQPSGRPAGPFLPLPQGPPGVGSTLPSGHGLSAAMIHWGSAFPPTQQQQQHCSQQHILQQQQQQQQQQPPSSGVGDNSEEEDDEYRPFTPPPPRERLSYTRYQLELLNGIYLEVRYPNSTQKQLIAKRVGITREQVKIWFQNRRRKDVVTKTGTKGEAKDGSSSSATTRSVTSPAEPSSNENSNQMEEGEGGGEGAGVSDTLQQRINMDSGVSTNPGSMSSNASAGSDFDNPNSHKSTDSASSCGVVNAGDGQAGIKAKSGVSAELSSHTTSTSTSSSSNSSSQMTMVSPLVLRSMIAELNKFDNEYLKMKKSKKKKSKSKSSKHLSHSTSSLPSSSALSSLSSCKAQRLFQSYDMVAPPNKVTPSAFLNTSANRFKHAGGTSAFQNPRESRVPPHGTVTSNDNRLWEGFGLSSGLQAPIDNSDILQQRSQADFVPSTLASALALPPTSHQSHFSGLLSGPPVPASHSLTSPQSPMYDNIPVLSDLLGSYKNHPSGASAMAAAAAAHRQLEHSLLASSQSGQPPAVGTGPMGYLPFPGSNPGESSGNSTSGDSGKSPSSDVPFPPSPSHFSLHHPHASHFALNRVFPFPLLADPPMMLSSIRQPETFRHVPHWPPSSPLNPQTSPPGSALTSHGTSAGTGLADDPFRPLMISSLSNPYFSPSSSGYSFPSSLTSSVLPPPPPLWSMQPPGSDTTTTNNFTQL